MRGLNDAVAVVIGASGGIGRAIARRLIEEGAVVVVAGASGRYDEIVAEAPAGRVQAFDCDLEQPQAAEALAQQCRERFGRVDVLVNNAGVSIGSHRLHEIELRDWNRLMTINLRGVFLGMKAFLPMMLEAKSGAIVNMASIAAERATAGVSAYCASKAGVLQLTRAAALEYAADGIRINAVCPGTVRTSLLDRSDPERLRFLTERVPMKRFAEPDEVASLTVFLASRDANYITGQAYFIDGGRMAA